MRIVKLAIVSLALAGLCASAALALHSATAQDFNKRVEVEGVIKTWEIANPHGRVVLTVSDAKGTRNLEFETHSRNNVYRAGYRDGMLKAGDKIKLLVAPNRDGSEGGYITGFVTAKGEKVGN